MNKINLKNRLLKIKLKGASTANAMVIGIAFIVGISFYLSLQFYKNYTSINQYYYLDLKVNYMKIISKYINYNISELKNLPSNTSKFYDLEEFNIPKSFIERRYKIAVIFGKKKVNKIFILSDVNLSRPEKDYIVKAYTDSGFVDGKERLTFKGAKHLAGLNLPNNYRHNLIHLSYDIGRAEPSEILSSNRLNGSTTAIGDLNMNNNKIENADDILLSDGRSLFSLLEVIRSFLTNIK